MEEAIRLIKEEMKEAQYKELGTYVIKAIETNRVVVEAIVKKEKTLAKCFQKCYELAKKKQKNNFYFMPEEEVYEIARKYFGITAIQEKIEIPETIEKEEKISFNVSLEDLLER